MALRLLLTDPNREWLSEAKDFFEGCSYDVDIAHTGKDAQLFLYNEKYFAIVLNALVQDHSAIQVLKYIRANNPSLTIVMLIPKLDDDTEIEFDEEYLKKFGVTNILPAPYELKDIQQMLEGHQSLKEMMNQLPSSKGKSTEEEVSIGDDEFSAIKISEFFSLKKVLFDIYIKLSSGKYLKILHAGDTFEKERIEKYKTEKNINELYFLAADRKKYIRFQNHMTRKFTENEKVSSKVKVNFLKSTTEKFIEDVHVDGMKPQVVDQAKEICETTYNLVKNDDNLFKVLKEFEEFDPNAYSHAFLATFFASMIVKQFEWESHITTETVALAGMFHDIGKMKLPPEIATKKIGELTEEQVELYKEHPNHSLEIVGTSKLITPSVKQVIVQHHEASDGSGFPNELSDSKILTLSKILILANDFADYLLEAQVKPPEALRVMLRDKKKVSKYNAIVLEHFLRAFIDPKALEKQDKAYDKKNALSNSKSANKKAS